MTLISIALSLGWVIFHYVQVEALIAAFIWAPWSRNKTYMVVLKLNVKCLRMTNENAMVFLKQMTVCSNLEVQHARYTG
jgi:hypothetical protein